MLDGGVITGLLGRKLRVAVIGGGGSARIAATHRLAMRFDDIFTIVAGVLSSDPCRSLSEGKSLGIARPYSDLSAMLAGEAGRTDGPDIVAIMTPNHAHQEGCRASLNAGYHVICDKPLANTLAEAEEIAALARRRDRLLCVTHNYSGYPMVRQMRAMVRDGAIGQIHQAQVRYAQGDLGTADVDKDPLSKALRWRLDPQLGGESNLLLDVGTHAHHLLDFVTGLDFHTLAADLGASSPDRPYDDTIMVFGRLTNGARACLIATKAATGAPQVLEIEVYGSEGGLSWRQQDPQSMIHWQPGAPSQHYHRAVNALDPDADAAIRRPRPHPEGFREAFANIYAAFGISVAEHLAGKFAGSRTPEWPSSDYALRSLRFVEACIESSAGARWLDIDAPEGR